ncbi:MAG: hypothetical protein ACOCR0_03595 [Haloferacaceae archaeon]
MAGRYGNIDYSTYAKGGFLLGFGLFAIAAIGELVIHLGNVQVAAWIATVLLDAGLAGLAVMLLAPAIFGVIMPLTE